MPNENRYDFVVDARFDVLDVSVTRKAFCDIDARLSKVEAEAAKQNAEQGWNGHASDCAAHNAPALPPGPCNCKTTQAPETRQPGWYWVKWTKHSTWEVIHNTDKDFGRYVVIGPRIPEPGQ